MFHRTQIILFDNCPVKDLFEELKELIKNFRKWKVLWCYCPVIELVFGFGETAQVQTLENPGKVCQIYEKKPRLFSIHKLYNLFKPFSPMKFEINYVLYSLKNWSHEIYVTKVV